MAHVTPRAPLVPFCIHGGLGLPALVIAHIVIYLIYIKLPIITIERNMKKEIVLAALEPICSCALLPLDATLLYKGHGIRSASSQVNSKCFQISPSRCMY